MSVLTHLERLWLLPNWDSDPQMLRGKWRGLEREVQQTSGVFSSCSSSSSSSSSSSGFYSSSSFSSSSSASSSSSFSSSPSVLGLESTLYSDSLGSETLIENTSVSQLLDYLDVISLPANIHSNHWLHFSIYFTINASSLTEQSSDEFGRQSIYSCKGGFLSARGSMCFVAGVKYFSFKRLSFSRASQLF